MTVRDPANTAAASPVQDGHPGRGLGKAQRLGRRPGPEAEGDRDDPLLDAVVQVSLDPPPVSSLAVKIRARDGIRLFRARTIAIELATGG